eukprot:782006-Prymnesium_polylepis.1
MTNALAPKLHAWRQRSRSASDLYDGAGSRAKAPAADRPDPCAARRSNLRGTWQPQHSARVASLPR